MPITIPMNPKKLNKAEPLMAHESMKEVNPSATGPSTNGDPVRLISALFLAFVILSFVHLVYDLKVWL